ncbi:mucin-like protein [Mya arenaria]|uniref:mucin-like protein n=1 Tax=Mya arenaria TaxID=6604 RepID=UPI0022DEEC3C|nr:mucin-like protein [Mya arenaria]
MVELIVMRTGSSIPATKSGSLVLTSIKSETVSTGSRRQLTNVPASGTDVLLSAEDVCILSPYWANMKYSTDPDSGIYVRVLRSSTPADQTELDDISTRFEQYTESDFSPEFAVVVTWRKMKYSSQPATFQAVLATDYLTTYYGIIYEQGGMRWQVPMSNVPGANNFYVARVGLYCATDNKYTYDYSQLPYAQIGDKPKIERIDTMYQVYDGFSTDPSVSLQKRKTSGAITYSDGTGEVTLPSYAARGIHFFTLAHVTTHPVLECKAWLGSASSIDDVTLAKYCPASFSQMIAPSRFDSQTVNGYTCYFIPSATDGNQGMRCCYSAAGVLQVTDDLVDGSNTYSLFRGLGSSNGDFVAEQTAYTMCCVNGASLTTEDICGSYLALRPVCTSKRFEAGGAGGGEGDPHITTLDGFMYTFNGHGEFVMIRSDTGSFELQGRFQPATVDGALSNATVTTSVVGQQTSPASDKVEFRINGAGDDIEVYLNDVLDTTDLSTGSSQGNNILVEKNADTYRMIFFAGVAVNVKPTSGLLSLSLALTSDWAGEIKGLVGNFDGNDTNEFQLPDGTDLGDPAGFTEEQIYNQYGTMWRVEEADSLFLYKAGESYSSINDLTFTPVFFNPDLTVMFPNTTERQTAQDICYQAGGTDPNPAENSECYFDFAVLKDETLAQNTANAIELVAAEQVQLANFPPVISNGDAALQLTEGETSLTLITLNATDANGDTITFTVMSGSVNGLSVDASSGEATLASVPDTYPFDVMVEATDGQSSTIWKPIIKYCACQNSGTCEFAVSVTEAFTVVPCTCTAAWEGDFCEVDKDGCADNPCYTGVACSDVPASQIQSKPAGFQCDACPLGLQGDGQDCQDVDECLQEPAVCGQLCTNEVGGHTCSCHPGYNLQPDLFTCADIGECVRGTDDCDAVATCTNTAGSFTCTCPNGYTDIGSGKSGDCQDIDECTAATATCQDNSACANTVGSYTCPCISGYQFNSVTSSCDNIDDCKLSSDCDQVCVDGVNTFTCSCNSGFVLNADGRTCDPSTVCDSTQLATCNGGNTSIATCAVDGGEVVCICDPGYALDADKNCTDVNECATGTDACSQASCTNTVGGYTCSCNQGYAFQAGSDKVCIDIDECGTDVDLCEASATCVNNAGSYACRCAEGYVLKSNGLGCEDNDECATVSTNDCDSSHGTCTNTAGSYSCSCTSGYTGDGYTCVDLNECNEADRGGCAQGCSNTIGGHSCFCGQGYTLNADGLACNDIDECLSSSTNNCYNNSYCSNTGGSYTCTCPTDFVLKADGVTCQSINQCSSDNTCEYTCNRINDVDTCTCQNGYQLNQDGSTCSDINECDAAGSTLCLDINNVVCQNTEGGYTCVCKDAFYTQLEPDRCVNKDECLTNPCSATSVCEDLVGDPGYRCDCMTGYTNVDGTCTDINECTAGTHMCHATLATCTNTEGDYTCACNSGYQGNGVTCTEVDECALGTHECDQIVGSCANTPGSYTCSCDGGYALGNDLTSCIGRM